MRINSVGNKVSSIRTYVFGVITIIIGIVFSLFANNFYQDQGNLVKISATISNYEVEYDDEGSSFIKATVDFNYEGVDYTNVTLNYATSNMSKDDVIEVKINAENPEKGANAISLFSTVILPNVGYVIILIGAIFILVKVNKNKKLNEAIKKGEENYVIDGSSDIPIYGAPKGIDENKTYSFHYCGKLNQSYVLEDENGEHIYEANLVKFSLVGSSTYEFINKINGLSKTHFIGKTVTDENSSGAFSIDHSYFKFDHQDAYAYIRSHGFDIDVKMKNVISPSYTILYHNEKVAIIELGSLRKQEGTGLKAALSNIPITGVYSVIMDETYLDDIFVILFYLAHI